MNKLTWMSIIPLLLAIGFTSGRADTKNDNDQALIDYMSKEYDLPFPEYEIEVVSNRLEDVDLLTSTFTVEPLTRREPIGLFTVAVNVTDDKGRSKSGQVNFRIHRFQEVLVLKDKIRRTEEISPDQVELERSEVTTLKEQPLTSVDELAGKRSARNLHKGAILTSGSLEVIPDVESGDQIEIIYAAANCRIAATGVALQTGTTGEYIKVKNSSSGKILMARIVDSKEVAIEL